MKKIIALILVVCMLFAFAACGGNTASDEPSSDVPTSEGTTMWKDKMATLEKIKGARIVVFQNLIKFDESAKDFSDFGSVPSEVEMSVAGETVKAYPISILEKIWNKDISSELTVIDKDGNKTTISAEDLKDAFVASLDDGTGVLKVGNTEVKNFKYLITAEKEMLVFVEAEETIAFSDIFTLLGYDASKNVYATASDGFWCCTDNVAESEASEIRGTLSGSVNCKLAVENKGGAGNINDLFYIDVVE